MIKKTGRNYLFQKKFILPLWILILLIVSAETTGQEKLSYKLIDSITYSMYEQGQWANLVKAGNNAIRQGYDYYYMRMRVGIAYYMLERYRIAAVHFEKALTYNKTHVAFNYLLQCYELGGLQYEAAALGKRFPGLFKTKDDKPGIIKKVSFFAGGSSSGSLRRISEIDIDGDANVYGEISVNGDMLYVNGGLTLAPAEQFRWYLGYTHLQLAKHQRIILSGSDTLIANYNLKQRQFLGSAPIRLQRNWQLIPAFNIIHVAFRPLIVNYDSLAANFFIRQADTTLINYLLSLKLIKQMPYLSIGGALAASNLNNSKQLQGTISANIYPFANLNLYGLSLASAQMEEGNLNWHFKLAVGAKLLPALWLQGSHLFGELKNTHTENGLLVYNTSGKIISCSSARLYFSVNDQVSLQLEFNFVKHEDYYLEYLDYNTFVWKPVHYNKHHLMGGIKWKL